MCVDGPQTVAVAEGENTRLTCRVDAQPDDDLSFIWIFNSTLDTIEVEQYRVTVLPGLSVLDYTPRYVVLRCVKTGRKVVPGKLVAGAGIFENLLLQQCSLWLTLCRNDADKIQKYFLETQEALSRTVKYFNVAIHVITNSHDPRSSRDYGMLSCWATNIVGSQADPCRFTVVEAGKSKYISSS